MTAVILVTAAALPGWLYLICGVVTIAGVFVVRREFAKRLLALFLLTLTLVAFPVALAADEYDDEFIRVNLCPQYEKWSYEWILLGCWRWDDPNGQTTTTSTTTTKPAPAPKPVKK